MTYATVSGYPFDGYDGSDESFEKMLEGGMGSTPGYGADPAPRTRTCTLLGCETAGDLVPWSGERLCWDCMDRQLDLIALAVQDCPVTIGQGVSAPGHVSRMHAGIDTARPWLDGMADDIVNELTRIAGESPDGLELVQKVVERTRYLTGVV